MRLARAPLILLPLATLLGQEAKYTLTGQLVVDDGQPVSNAEITVTRNGWNEFADPVLSDAQGRFAFSGLPEGTFIVTASRSDPGSYFYGQSPQPMQMTGLNLNAKFPSQDILFRIERFGAITGTVRDRSGMPMANVPVSAIRRSWANGRAAMQATGSSATDDLGHFRIPSVLRGRYRVCASAPPGGESALPVGYAAFGQPPREIYAATCQPDARSSGLFEVASGSKLEVDLVLGAQTPVEVSGHVVNMREGESLGVQLQPRDPSAAGSAFYSQAAGEAHEFQFANVVPGRYWVSANGSSNIEGIETVLTARVPVTVGDSGLIGIELTLAPQNAIDVVMHAPKHEGEITVGLRDADEPFAGSSDAQKQADGSLRITLQYPGRYWLVTRTQLCPSGANLGKVDANDRPIDITPGMNATLDVTFTDQCGEINGTVVDSDGKPVPKARNLILLTGTPDEPGDLFLTSAEADGTFFYNGLKPGTYYLWAWNESDEWNGSVPDLSEIKARKTAVEIKGVENVKIQVPLTSGLRSK